MDVLTQYRFINHSTTRVSLHIDNNKEHLAHVFKWAALWSGNAESLAREIMNYTTIHIDYYDAGTLERVDWYALAKYYLAKLSNQ